MTDEGASPAYSLPFNRKERYFTGTVLPMIIGCDEFAHLDRFLHCCGIDVDARTIALTWPQLTFYTEYGYAESLAKATTTGGPKATPDTPDVVIAGSNWILAIEAKMYSRVTAPALTQQAELQQKLLHHMKPTPDTLTVHQLLLPGELAAQLALPDRTVVTWEQVLADYQDVAPLYWREVLQHALSVWPQLTSSAWAGPKNGDDKLPGSAIWDGYWSGTLPHRYVGCRCGLNAFLADVTPPAGVEPITARAAWRTKQYTVAVDEPAGGLNKNWFSLDDFILHVRPHVLFEYDIADGPDHRLYMQHAAFIGDDRISNATHFSHWCNTIGGVTLIDHEATTLDTDGRCVGAARVHFVLEAGPAANVNVRNAIAGWHGVYEPGRDGPFAFRQPFRL